MKTTIILKIAIWSLILINTFASMSQSRYLKITLNDQETISYPPQTKFELRDEKGAIVFTDTSLSKVFKIESTHTLYVKPSYNDKTEIYKIEKGKLEILSNAEYDKALAKHNANPKQKRSSYKYDKNDFTKGLNMKKTLEISTLNPNLYNANFEFNNGIDAYYNDGEMVALKDGKSLKIVGKYLIYHDNQVIKLSFNPKNGETWWVVEDL